MIIGQPFERNRSHSLFLPLVLLCLVFLGFVIVYASLVPPFEGPDAGAHFGYIVYLHRHVQYPPMDSETANFSHQLVQQPPLYYLLVRFLTPANWVEQAHQLDILNPYYGLGLSKRATVSAPLITWQATLPIWIARGVAMLGGLLTLIGTYGLMYRLTWKKGIAIATASVVGFNPQFLFSSVSVTNDTWASALVVLTLWLALYMLQTNRLSTAWIWVGVLMGGAALAKYSGVLVIGPLCLILVRNGKQLGWRRMVIPALYLLLGSGLVAGFWYGRNLVLWKTLIPTDLMLTLLPGLSREVPVSWPELWQQIRWLLRSYWGVFGYGVLAQPQYYQFTQFLIQFAILGWLVWIIRSAFDYLRGIDRRESFFILSVALLWFAITFVALINWMRLVRFTDQGRLLFPAAPAIAFLLVVGWQAWFPERWHERIYRAIPILLCGLALSQIPTLAWNYRLPSAVNSPIQFDREINAKFLGGMTLPGIDFPDGASVDEHGELPIVLYWSTPHQIENFYTLFLHLADKQGNLLYQYDGVPDQSRHPTRQWIPGEIFADPYTIKVYDVEDGLATLSLGFYPYNEPYHRQPVLGPENTAITDRVILSQVRLHSSRQSTQSSNREAHVQWENGISLLDTKVLLSQDGLPYQIQLLWKSEAVIHRNYTVFVQILDDEDQMLAQIDRYPQNGEFPTSTWRVGDEINDIYDFEDPNVSNWQRIIVGLYDAETGQRLLLKDTAEERDFLELVTLDR